MVNKLYYSFNENTLIYLLIGIIIYVLCIFNIVPDNLKVIMNKPILKIIFLSIILFVSTRDFTLSLLLTIVYFGVIKTINYETFNNAVSSPFVDANGNEDSVKRVINEKISDTDLLDGIKNFGESQIIDPKDKRAIYSIKGEKCNNDNVDKEPRSNQFNFDLAICGNNFEEKRKLQEVSKCAINKLDETPYFNKLSLDSCAAAYGYIFKRVCKNKNENGTCLDIYDNPISNELTNDQIQTMIDDNQIPSKISFEPAKNTNGYELKSHTLETITDDYLKYPESIGFAKGSIPFMDVDNIFYYKIPQMFGTGSIYPEPSTNYKSKIPFYKLVNGYEYVYEYFTNDITTNLGTSIPFEINKSLFEQAIDTTQTSIFSNRINPNVPNNLVSFEAGQNYAPIRIVIKHQTDNNVYDLGFYRLEDNSFYEFKIYDYNNVTFNENGTRDPLVQIPNIFVIDPNNTSTTTTFYHEDMMNDDNTFMIDSDGNRMKKYHPEFKNKFMLNEEKFVLKSKYLAYKPFESDEIIGSDGYVEQINSYANDKKYWEDHTSKLIMRSIGCHRLRKEEIYDYGYWDDIDNKCSFEKEITPQQNYTTTVG